jgi:hypothetical protein
LGSETLGSENVSFSSFDTDHTSSWDGFYDSLTFDTDHFNLQRSSADGRAKRALGVTLTTGKAYRVSVVAKANGSAQNIKVGVTNSAFQQTDLTIYNAGTSYATYTHDFIADSDTTHAMIWNNSSSSNVDYQSYSIKQITLEDSEGSNDGTPVGATTNTGYTYSPHGVVDPLNFGEVYSGRALDFDGTNDFVNTGVSPRALVGSSSAFTVSAWINAQDDDNEYIVGAMESGAERFYLRVVDNGGTGYVKWGYGDTASSDQLAPVNLNQWHHVAWTYDTTNAKVYVDGSLKYTNAISGKTITNTDNLYIGALNNNGSTVNYFNGKINTVKIFNTALTQDQVRELYTKPETVLPTGVSASYYLLEYLHRI